jgi:hypothetical protein
LPFKRRNTPNEIITAKYARMVAITKTPPQILITSNKASEITSAINIIDRETCHVELKSDIA